MEPIGIFAVAVGILSFVLIAVVSLRSTGRRKPGYWRDGAFVPYPHTHHGDHDGAGHRDFADGS